MQLGNHIIIAVKKSLKQAGQKQPVAEIKISHNPEINRNQHPVSSDENIARVHIRMEIAITEDLIEKALSGPLCDDINIMAC